MASSPFPPTFPVKSPVIKTAIFKDHSSGDSVFMVTSPPPTPRQRVDSKELSYSVVARGDQELKILAVEEPATDHYKTTETPENESEKTQSSSVPATTEEAFDGAYLQTEQGMVLRQKLSSMVARFRARSEEAKELVMLSPTENENIEYNVQPIATAFPDIGFHEPQEEPVLDSLSSVVICCFGKQILVPNFFFKIPRPAPFDFHSRVYLIWLTCVCLAFIYNVIVIPFRAAFPVHTEANLKFWLSADYFCDLLYIVDVVIWKPSIITYVDGIETRDQKRIFQTYVNSNDFLLDILSLAPLDLFYLIPQVGYNTLFRVNRVLKIHIYWEILNRVDQIATNPYYFRVLRTFSYMMYLIHVNACFYYYFSYLHDFSPNDNFVFNNNHPQCQSKTNRNKNCNFPGEYNAYVFCFFFSVSMITIIGNLNFPLLVSEILYSTILWFLGIFIFATLIGQIRDVLRATTRQEDQFYEIMDAIVEHMQTLKIPKELQSRVRIWLHYNWEQQKTIDERQLLDGLPVKLRSDLAMQVHYSTIHKVQLFRHLDKKVAEDLLLRLRPTVYLPGDFICRKGEIGKEMYIIKSGLLEVILPDGRLAVTLGPGSVFGEISLLALAGSNRRTADVRSKGFSDLYVLSKTDLNTVMKDYPATLESMKQKAKELLNRGKPAPERIITPPPIEIFHPRERTPALFRIALNALNVNSPTHRRMTQSQIQKRTQLLDTLNSIDSEIELEVGFTSDFDTATDLDTVFSDPMVDHRAAVAVSKVVLRKDEMQQGNEPEKSTHGRSSVAEKQRRNSSRSRSRSRSPVNMPDSSWSDSEASVGHQLVVRPQKRHSRTPSLRSGHSSRTSSRRSSRRSSLPTKGTVVAQDETNDAKRVPAIMQPAALLRGLSGLTGFHQRFFNYPKVQPIETDIDLEDKNSPQSSSPAIVVIKKSVFDFGPIPCDVTERHPSLVYTSDFYINPSDTMEEIGNLSSSSNRSLWNF